jgi:hypothetical protein
VVLLFAIILPPLINLSRYQRRIVNSLSRSLGREVTIGTLSVRLLPMPALVMTDVVVHEGPGFGAEPALRAPSVTAQLRLTSLWRGRLEVSHVELSDASLNLVRDRSGRWNVGAILLQASHVANAPTGERRAGPAPRFPYIEITDSRLNVKQGAEKLPYSLLNANVSMWLAEPDIWQIRLEGQPVRTDIELGLADTGVLRVEGKLHRATALGQMPLALHGEWTNAPLGQAGRLLLGSDPGWRGDLDATADVAGDLDRLTIKTHFAVANLHRQEFTPPEPFAIDATCLATYSRAAPVLSDLSCRWPVRDGQMLLAGSLALGVRSSQSEQLARQDSTLTLTVQRLPVGFLLAAAGLAHSDFAPAFHLDGSLDGLLFYKAQAGDAPLYSGELDASGLKLSAAGLETPLEIAGARLSAATPAPSGVSTLVLSADPVDLGGPAPVRIDAQLTTQGFHLHAAGSASLARLEELGHATHVQPPALAWLAPQGTAEFDVTRSAGWQQPGPASTPIPPNGHALSPVTYPGAPVTEGWLRLHNAKYAPRFLAEAVTVPTAEASLLPGRIAWSIPSVVFHGLPLQLSATYPLDCLGQADCVTHFRAICATLDGGALVAALMGEDQHLLDQLLKRLDSSPKPWPAMEGTVHAETLTLGRLSLRNLDASLSIADRRADIRSLDAQALGGTLHAEGSITAEDNVPRYRLSTTLARASASAAGNLFHENWGGGVITLSSDLELAGVGTAQLTASATGPFHGEWLRGNLGTATPLARFASWTAEGHIENRTFTLSQGQLAFNAASRLLPVTGSIGFDRTLSLQLGVTGGGGAQSDPPITVTGTLPRPERQGSESPVAGAQSYR